MVEKGRAGFNIMREEEEYTGNTKGNEWHGDNLKKKGGYVRE